MKELFIFSWVSGLFVNNLGWSEDPGSSPHEEHTPSSNEDCDGRCSKCRRQRGSQGGSVVLSQLMWMVQKHSFVSPGAKTQVHGL